MQRLLTLIPIAVLLAVALVACGAGDDEGGFFETAASAGQSAPAMAMDDADFAESEEMAVEQAAAPMAEPAPGDGGDGPAALQTAERRVISTGFVSVEVEDVPAAAEQVRIAAESLGGFVENSVVSGDDEQAFADVTIRVPQDVFLDALDRIRRIGEVRSEDLRAQDVTEQFIDLNARLRSALRTEGSLLGLLDRATDVEDVIAIERELSRVRADIERLQGQLNFLERRVALATLSVSLFTPSAARTEPPSAYFGIESDDVAGDIAAVESVAASLGGLIDSSVITVDDGEASGFVEIRVPRGDFARAVRAVDAIGDVRSKTVRTGEGADDPAAAYGDQPDARIDVQLQEARSADADEVVVFVVLVLVGLLVVALIAYGARRVRRRRAAPSE
ncbi:MAG: DUF4349 domain-containing protein [Chloroflexi bacterium]|nr:DUF4349 domain-containing protein [Chloroflexota bacterium]